jgi:hypothetical protein
MSDDRAKDEDLMLRVAQGNREAMGPLLRRYASPLLTFIRRMTGDWHRAEEVFQDVFLAVWQYRGRYDYPGPFGRGSSASPPTSAAPNFARRPAWPSPRRTGSICPSRTGRRPSRPPSTLKRRRW